MQNIAMRVVDAFWLAGRPRCIIDVRQVIGLRASPKPTCGRAGGVDIDHRQAGGFGEACRQFTRSRHRQDDTCTTPLDRAGQASFGKNGIEREIASPCFERSHDRNRQRRTLFGEHYHRVVARVAAFDEDGGHGVRRTVQFGVSSNSGPEQGSPSG